MKQIRAIVTGRVQGVCFRAETARAARRLGCRGFVRNLDNGDVEVLAQGEDEQIEQLLKFLHHGPSLARVENVQVAWLADAKVGSEFQIRH